MIQACIELEDMDDVSDASPIINEDALVHFEQRCVMLQQEVVVLLLHVRAWLELRFVSNQVLEKRLAKLEDLVGHKEVVGTVFD